MFGTASDSLLKVRLLTYCYGETYEEALLQSARKIVDGWGQTSLTSEQIEAVEELRNIEENPIHGNMSMSKK